MRILITITFYKKPQEIPTSSQFQFIQTSFLANILVFQKMRLNNIQQLNHIHVVEIHSTTNLIWAYLQE